MNEPTKKKQNQVSADFQIEPFPLEAVLIQTTHHSMEAWCLYLQAKHARMLIGISPFPAVKVTFRQRLQRSLTLT
jgi:hypothetical protein